MTSISFFYAARSKSNIKAYLWTSLIGLPSCWNHFKMAKSGLIERSADHLRMTFQLQHIDICWPLSELSTVWFEKKMVNPQVGCTTPLKNGPKWYKNLVIFGIHFVVRRRESWTPNCKLARGALRVLLLYIYVYVCMYSLKQVVQKSCRAIRNWYVDPRWSHSMAKCQILSTLSLSIKV